MTAVPFALSIHKFIDSIGADAGFAAIIGLALMALLYFAQARESASLRDELDDAANRIASVEGRLTQVVRTQVARQDADANVPPAIVPAPAIAGGVPRPGAMPATAGVASRLVPAIAFVGAPAGMGAPALASATRAIPPGVLGPVAPVPAGTLTAAALTVPEALVPVGVAETQRAAEDTILAASATAAGAASATAAGAAGGSGGTAVAPPPVGPRRVDFLDEEPGGPPPRRTVPPPARDRDQPRFRGVRIIQAVIAVVVVAALVIVLLSASGGNPKAPKAAVRPRHHHHGVVFNPARVNVAVLNGTAVNGLAAEIGAKLATDKYNVPQATITNAATQSQTTTLVGYQAGDRTDAVAVAKALGLSAADAQPASASAIQSCAAAGSSTNGATGVTTTGVCSAQVIITVGTDIAAAYGAGNSAG
jgi:hypothetical protein